MNHEHIVQRLQDYLDGVLPAREAGEIEAHLLACESCREEFTELRRLVDLAADLPEEIQPGRDLWAGIANRLADPSLGAQPSRWRAFWHAFTVWRGFWPTTVASAAVVLLVILVNVRPSTPGHGGYATDTAAEFPDDVTVTEDGAVPPDPVAVAMVDALEAECAAGERELQELNNSGDEGIIAILGSFTKDLRIIDQAISEARQAWTENPNCPRMVRILAAAYRAKATLQERATEVASAT
jgi:hypothetical protein